MNYKNRIKNILFVLFRLIPVNNHKVLFDNFIGRGFGCNPKYIAQELKKINPNLDCVWLSQRPFLNCDREGGRNVRIGSIRAIYEQATAKVWVANNRQKDFVRKRKNQTYIQTWHGAIGIKKCEGDMGDNIDPAWKVCAINDANMIDLMISNSRFCTNVYKRAFWYNGPVWEVGYPRNDLMLKADKNMEQKVKDHFKLEADTKIFLYAPTFRKVRENWKSDSLDLNRVLAALHKKFGGKWVCLLRLHPFAIKILENNITYTDQIINASKYEDMQELMNASDAMCTDYSSCIFDFIFSRKLALMFAPDMESFLQERTFHFDPYKLPFTCSLTNDEIETAILNHNQENYEKAIDKFIVDEGVVEHGDAAKNVAALIQAICEKDKSEIKKINNIV